MVEPSGHCPYIGLKQNRAIRFASPTPEHRCFVQGEPIEIPVDQRSYCLDQGHVHCPLYLGLSNPADSTAPPPIWEAEAAPGGLRGWLDTLSPRDRQIYLGMLSLLGLVLLLSVAGLLGLLPGTDNTATQPTTLPSVAAQTVVSVGDATTRPTEPPATPTDLPTSVPTSAPTDRPTTEPLILLTTVPTAQATVLATSQPTAQPATPATSQPTAQATAQPTSALPVKPTAVPTVQPTVQPTALPTSAPLPTARPAPTAAPTRPPLPPTRPPAAPTSAPSPTQVLAENRRLTLYFGDPTGGLYVPVERIVRVENRQVARAAIQALLDGPRGGLQRLVLPNAGLRDLAIADGTATVSFERAPTGAGDTRGFYAMALTLTELPNIQRVRFLVGGKVVEVDGRQNLARPVLNPLNPEGLSQNYSSTAFLPLYFPSSDGVHDVRVIRMVPRTAQVAEATVRALLEGPGAFGYALRRVIPADTELRGLRLGSDGVLTVDFTQPFADSPDRAAAARTLAASLTTLPNVSGVQLLVEGRPVAEQWGDSYREILRRPLINGEGL
ncbi:MAG TPA: GerMN domain-containing protein [Roseiflexaceae bacterium]|nr:GerMN domain-containing protein [Roseiflexaceae bacterium]